MASQTKPGQWVKIKIKSEPRTQAGRKTLVRLCEKDPAVKKERVRLKRSRPTGEHQRGGRMFKDRPPRLQAVRLEPGATYRVFASVDVLQDITSIEKYVEVTPA